MSPFCSRTDNGDTEYLWAQVVSWDGDRVVVDFLNHPVSHEGEFMPRQTLPVAEIVDWEVHLPDGHTRGGFSTQAMIAIARETGQRIARRLRKGRFIDPLQVPVARASLRLSSRRP